MNNPINIAKVAAVDISIQRRPGLLNFSIIIFNFALLVLKSVATLNVSSDMYSINI